MRIAFGLSVVFVFALALAGCGATCHEQSSDDWSSSSTSGTSSTDVDAGIDSGLDAGADGGNPVRDRAMALFARSCTPCHRHEGAVDYRATARGVFLETDEEILALASAYTVGRTPTGLRSIIGQRAEGYDLMVGENNQTPMPPPSSSFAPWTQAEAEQVMEWLRVPR